jgi:hypothetical protein
VRTVRRVPSRVSISIWLLRGKAAGLLRVKVRREVSGRSSGLARAMSLPGAGSCVLPSSVMTGRGAETVMGSVSTRPSCRAIFAVRRSSMWMAGVAGEAGSERRSEVGVGFAVAGGLGREDEVAEGELVDLVEARSGEEQGAVAGVEFDGGDVGGLGEGARGELVGAGLVVLLDGEMEVAGGEVVLLRQGERERFGWS